MKKKKRAKRGKQRSPTRLKASGTEYWIKHLETGTLLEAIESNKGPAKRFFGESALRRANFSELSEITLARAILESSDANLEESLLENESVTKPIRTRLISTMRRMSKKESTDLQDLVEGTTSKMPTILRLNTDELETFIQGSKLTQAFDFNSHDVRRRFAHLLRRQAARVIAKHVT